MQYIPWADGWTDSWLNGCMAGRVAECVHGATDGRIGLQDAWMPVYDRWLDGWADGMDV